MDYRLEPTRPNLLSFLVKRISSYFKYDLNYSTNGIFIARLGSLYILSHAYVPCCSKSFYRVFECNLFTLPTTCSGMLKQGQRTKRQTRWHTSLFQLLIFSTQLQHLWLCIKPDDSLRHSSAFHKHRILRKRVSLALPLHCFGTFGIYCLARHLQQRRGYFNLPKVS